MPNYMFNAYGASIDWIARDRAAAARHRGRDDRSQPHDLSRQGQGRADHRQKATEKPKEAVEYAIDVVTKNCVWSVNGGFDPERTAWTIDNSAENGDIEKDKKPTPEQVANIALANEAVEAAGGPVTHRQAARTDLRIATVAVRPRASGDPDDKRLDSRLARE